MLKVLLTQYTIIVGSLTVRNLGTLEDSVNYMLWLPGSVQLVKEDTGVLCSMKLSKIPFLGNVN